MTENDVIFDVYVNDELTESFPTKSDALSFIETFHDGEDVVVEQYELTDDIYLTEDDEYEEIDMALSDLYKLAEYSDKLFDMVEEMDDLEPWVSSKITKASDYISSVYHYLNYQNSKSDMDFDLDL